MSEKLYRWSYAIRNKEAAVIDKDQLLDKLSFGTDVQASLWRDELQKQFPDHLVILIQEEKISKETLNQINTSRYEIMVQKKSLDQFETKLALTLGQTEEEKLLSSRKIRLIAAKESAAEYYGNEIPVPLQRIFEAEERNLNGS